MPQNLLYLSSSIFNGEGKSSALARQFIDAWQQSNPGATVVKRDLVRDPLPHLDGARFQAFLTKPEERTPEQARIVAESDALIDELRAADVIVLGLPMYNFALPSQLKAYFDHVTRAGVTFRYTDQGTSEGLLKGKKAYVFAARGGLYAGTPDENQSPYIRTILSFIGIEDIEFVYAEGMAMGPEASERGMAAAKAAVGRLSRALQPPRALAAQG